MRKIGSLGLTIGASIVAVSAGAFAFLAFANDKSGQVAEEVANAGSVPIPDRPDWNWDVRPTIRCRPRRRTRPCRPVRSR